MLKNTENAANDKNETVFRKTKMLKKEASKSSFSYFSSLSKSNVISWALNLDDCFSERKLNTG